ncbi:YidC/Oxa1 family membrane protein insertase [Candidatus Dojkabacteria bacterium]|nr:YidC/Oxa1 family membrane protein insertase [Candidatus Dojkabacteria bacterium]
MGTLFRILFYQPTFNLLIIFYRFFAGNLGWAIVGVAVLSRLITYPITKSQIKSAEKGKEFQKKYEKLKKKYGKNKEKLNDELMKLQSKYLPSQLGGCLPIIILIILLIQVRGGIRNLVDQGWHAFNQVAYVESLKRDEDYIKYQPEEDLETGEHKIKVKVKTNEGNELEQEYSFEVVDDEEAREKEIAESEKNKSDEEKNEERKKLEEEAKKMRESDISLYSEYLAENADVIAVKRFLFFVSEKKAAYLVTARKPELDFYLRPPSNQVLLIEETEVYFDDEDVTEKCDIGEGESINLNFLGIDLSKVAADFSWSNPEIIPYVVLAILVGGSQYATTQILSGIKNIGPEKKKESAKKSKKKKKGEEEMPDMSELMSMTSKQMMFMFPVLTIITSLGYWGGSNIFPSGLSIFWTVQSLFVIIQQLLMNRKKILDALKLKIGKEVK